MARVPAGDVFSSRQREEIVRAIRIARQESGLSFSVYLGNLTEQPRAYAARLHEGLDDPARSVLVAVDPDRRRVEIVTGSQAQRSLDDHSCALAAMTMTSAFSLGDLVGGITGGVVMLGEHARRPRTLHTETP